MSLAVGHYAPPGMNLNEQMKFGGDALAGGNPADMRESGGEVGVANRYRCPGGGARRTISVDGGP